MNMKKEYRAELRGLNKTERITRRTFRAFVQGKRKTLRDLARVVARAERETKRDLALIARRRGILEGRLS